MRRCKICGEPAQLTGRAYCKFHMEQVNTRNANYEAMKALLPKCDDCGQPLTKSAADRGDVCCAECEAKRIAAEEVEDQRAALLACETLDELKSWLEENLLTDRGL